MDKLLQAHFLSLYCMVLADGIIEAKELEMLYRIGTENYGLTLEQITEAIKESGTSFVSPQSLEEKIQTLYDMCRIAWADDVIDESETNLLKKYILKMGFQTENADGIASFMLESVKQGKTVSEILSQIQ